jgi:hypothetical protein
MVFSESAGALRSVVMALVRRQVRKSLYAQGMGRHTSEEITVLATRSIDSIADFLGDKTFFMGPEPVGVDATIFAFLAGTLCPAFDTPIRTAPTPAPPRQA